MASQVVAPLLEVEQVAQRLHCSTETVRRLIRRGDLVASRFSPRGRLRVDPVELEEFIERQAVGRG